MRNRAPFDDVALRKELARRLSQTPAFSLPADAAVRSLNVKIELLDDDETWRAFVEVVDWFKEQL